MRDMTDWMRQEERLQQRQKRNMKLVIGVVLAVVILMFTGLSVRAFWFGDSIAGVLCGIAAFMVGNGIFWRVKNKDWTP